MLGGGTSASTQIAIALDYDDTGDGSATTISLTANVGMAACGRYHGHEAGLEYIWGSGIKFLGRNGCTEAGF